MLVTILTSRFDVGNLPKIEPNWDGHTTREKWTRVAEGAGIEVTP